MTKETAQSTVDTIKCKSEKKVKKKFLARKNEHLEQFFFQKFISQTFAKMSSKYLQNFHFNFIKR